MADLKLGNIKPVGADNVVVESKYVKGSYVVVANTDERDSLKGEAGENIVVGSLCYCQADSTFYQYNGIGWDESLSFAGYATEGYVDEEVKNELEKLAETIPSIEGLASEEFVTESIKNKVDDTTLENYYTKTEADEEFMTQSEVDTRINDVISKASNTDTIKDLTSLVDYLDSHGTEASEMATAISSLEENKADKTELENLVTEQFVKDALAEIDLSDYYTKDEIGDVISESVPEITYTNDTPIITPIGSIIKDQTFNKVSIQDMLTMILYPYVPIEVETTVTASQTPGSYDVKNLPTLSSVSITVKKNSATNLQFSLWDTTNKVQVGNTLTENNISNGKLTFSNLNYSIDTTRTFSIKYTYKGEGGVDSAVQTVSVGTFTITFTNPKVSAPTSDLSTTSYKTGQSATVNQITVSAPTLNSAEKITKLELYKNNSKVGSTIENPTFPHSFTGLADTITSNTNYKIKAYFNSRTGSNTTYTESSVESNNLTISFTYEDASISLSGSSSNSSISKLNPQNISAKTLKATFKKNSDKITNVKLFANDVEAENSAVNGFNGDTYSSSEGSVTFNYSKSNICSDLNLEAVAYNGNADVATSNSISIKFYAPYCYGYVDESVTFAKVNSDVLNSLANKGKNMTVLVDIASQGYKKFIYAIPNGNYKSAKDSDGNGDENFSLFENSESVANTKKEIEFADGSKVTYQILIFRDATGNDTNLYFRT